MERQSKQVRLIEKKAAEWGYRTEKLTPYNVTTISIVHPIKTLWLCRLTFGFPWKARYYDKYTPRTWTTEPEYRFKESWMPDFDEVDFWIFLKVFVRTAKSVGK